MPNLVLTVTGLLMLRTGVVRGRRWHRSGRPDHGVVPDLGHRFGWRRPGGAVFVATASVFATADVAPRRPAESQRCWQAGQGGRPALPWPTIGDAVSGRRGAAAPVERRRRVSRGSKLVASKFSWKCLRTPTSLCPSIANQGACAQNDCCGPPSRPDATPIAPPTHRNNGFRRRPAESVAESTRHGKLPR